MISTSSETRSMLQAHLRYPDGTFETSDSLIEVARALRESGVQCWLDLESPDEWTLALLGEAFSFHPLAIEDCLHGEQRPRIDPYDGHIFMVIYGPVIDEHQQFQGGRELAIFCSGQYIVTIHHEPVRTLETLRERCRRDPENVLARGMDRLLHMIVDGLIDRYQPILDRLEHEATVLEDSALHEPESGVLQRISDVRSELLQIRRYLIPLRESIGQLARGEYSFIGQNIQPYFRDVFDHLVRTAEMLDLYREQVVGARDVWMSAISQRTNDTMRTLSSFATIMLPLTLLAGIYGMNFQHLWPPTDHPYGFWLVIGCMIGVGTGLYAWFRRAHWI